MQEQKAGLSKREKRLLLGAAVVGLFYLAFQFVFLPYYNSYNDKTTEYGELLMQRTQVENDLANEANVRKNNEEAKAKYAEIKLIYLLAGNNTDLGRRLTDICTDNGLKATGQKLETPVDFRVPRADGEPPVGQAAFSAVTVPMTVSGEYGAIKRLLDIVDKNEDIRVSRVSFSMNRDTEDATPETVLERVTVTFVVTLLNGLE